MESEQTIDFRIMSSTCTQRTGEARSSASWSWTAAGSPPIGALGRSHDSRSILQ